MNQIWCKANWMRIIANFMQKHNQLHSIPKICFESSYLSHATFECEWNSDSETLVQSSMYQSLSGVFSSPAKSMVLYSVPHKFISNCLFCLTFASFILLSVGQLPHYSLSHLFFSRSIANLCKCFLLRLKFVWVSFFFRLWSVSVRINKQQFVKTYD